MNQKKKIILIGTFLLVVMIGGGYFYIFKSAHRNIAEEVATANFKAPELLYKFIHSKAETNTHIDQVIKVSGQVTSIEQKTIVLDNMVQVDLTTSLDTTIKNGKSITIKGRCVGYDDLLEVVKIDQANLLSE